MDKKKLEAFKKRLEIRQQELRRTVTRTQQDGRSADEDTAQDIADRAASSYTKEFLFSQSNNERQLLQMVDRALVRIREGSFGECIHCGKEINAKRLEAVPWTRHCIECQEKLEQGLRGKLRVRRICCAWRRRALGGVLHLVSDSFQALRFVRSSAHFYVLASAAINLFYRAHKS